MRIRLVPWLCHSAPESPWRRCCCGRRCLRWWSLAGGRCTWSRGWSPPSDWTHPQTGLSTERVEDRHWGSIKNCPHWVLKFRRLFPIKAAWSHGCALKVTPASLWNNKNAPTKLWIYLYISLSVTVTVSSSLLQNFQPHISSLENDSKQDSYNTVFVLSSLQVTVCVNCVSVNTVILEKQLFMLSEPALDKQMKKADRNMPE